MHCYNYSITFAPEIQEMLESLDQELQEKLNCKLCEVQCCTGADDEGLEYSLWHFYTKSLDGNVLIHKISDLYRGFFDINDIDNKISGGTFADGNIIKDNTIIIKLLQYC